MKTIVENLNVAAYLILKILFDEHKKFDGQITRHNYETLMALLRQRIEPVDLDAVIGELSFEGLIHFNVPNSTEKQLEIYINSKGINAYEKFKSDEYFIAKTKEVNELYNNVKAADILLFENVDNINDDFKLRVIRTELCNYFFGEYLGV